MKNLRQKTKNSIKIKSSALVVFGLFASASWAKPVTLTFITGDARYTLTFESSKISEGRLRNLVILSPFVVDYTDATATKDFWASGSKVGDEVNKALLALPLEQCIAADPAYTDCAKNDVSAPNFLRNAEINLQKSKQGLDWLRHLDYPGELEPVVKFLQGRLALSLWIEETRFRYYKTRDESVLNEAHEGIDPAQVCQETFRKLDAASSKQEKYTIVRFDWANCMVRAVDHRLGRYPTSSWNVFLQAYGITEHYTEKGPD